MNLIDCSNSKADYCFASIASCAIYHLLILILNYVRYPTQLSNVVRCCRQILKLVPSFFW